MGNGQEGSTSTVTITSDKEHKSGNFKLMIYALNKKVFERAYAALADEQLELTGFSDTEICGKVKAKEDGIMFLSIPYEKGWKVYIDGEKTETFKLLQAMLGVRVGKGEHDIRIEYTPEGFPLGVTITIVSLILIVLIVFFERQRKLKKQRLAALAAAEARQAEENYPKFPYGNKAEIYDQVSESLLAEDIGRVEDSEVVLYDGNDSDEKEAEDA